MEFHGYTVHPKKIQNRFWSSVKYTSRPMNEIIAAKQQGIPVLYADILFSIDSFIIDAL